MSHPRELAGQDRCHQRSRAGSASGHPAYHASKVPCRSIPRPPRSVVGPSGVRVNTVHPGYIPPMLNATNANERAHKMVLTLLPHGTKPVG